MVEYLEQLTIWHWLIAAVVFVVLEALIPGAVFMWLGVAAGITGLTLLAIPDMAWESQGLLFAVLSMGSVVLGRMWMRSNPSETDQPSLNRRGAQYVGRTFTLTEDIVNGHGKIHVDDTTWKVACDEDLKSGEAVSVTDVDGVVLKATKKI